MKRTRLNYLTNKLIGLPASHKEALLWFHEHRDQEVTWPSPLQNGMFLVNRAKGIHKPAGSAYALSVRESLKGPYPDREPEFAPDGSWTYPYFQELADPGDRDSTYTNRALLACERDEVPVGVIRQVKAKPNPRYKVLGLALVRGWKDGYFLLEGLPDTPNGQKPGRTGSEDLADDAFEPSNVNDERFRTQASIVQRQGQGQFRSALLLAYGKCCAISGCNVVEALEAAHIYPYLGINTNVVPNGLLLRSDLHALYDLGLIAIDPVNFEVAISPRLQGTTHGHFAGRRISLPAKIEDLPSVAALQMQFNWAKEKWAATNEAPISRRAKSANSLQALSTVAT